MLDQQTFLNDDLVLKVKKKTDPAKFDPSAYEPFIDALCGTRDYQKEAIRVAIRYFLGGQYTSLRQLAEENFRDNPKLAERYGTFDEMAKHLQLPDQLSCSVDLATATGKSYVMYGIARIMLAHGVIDRVLVLCPSRTIENGLTEKFRQLSSDMTLKSLLPQTSRVLNPHIINGTESIVDGSICIENRHAALEYVQSSIRESLKGKGKRTLVLNDEVHHVYNQTDKGMKKWKEFLVDPEFGFYYIAGFSGTCYVDDDYFSDVLTRYSLRKAIEEGYAKIIDYVSEDSSDSDYEQFQKIYDNHIQNKTQFYRKVKPLTILITRDIADCKKLAIELIKFLAEQEGISEEAATKKILIVTSAREHQANARLLPDVDRPDMPVEWITSVSMLTEGWDVKNVFQIVPHEKRAFDSKLLIAQVLGRGLRIPDEYKGERPVVKVFNHANWSGQIKHLVDEVMEIEKRVYSQPVTKTPDYNFQLHKIDYLKNPELEEYPQTDEYEFSKPVKLVSQVSSLERETTYIRATTGDQHQKKTLVRYRMWTIDEVAEHIHNKLKAIDTEKGTNYRTKYSLDWLKALIKKSLELVGEKEDKVSDENRQTLQKAFGVIHRESSQTVRYRMTPNAVKSVQTNARQRNSAGVGSLRRGETTVFLDDDSIGFCDDETRVVLENILADESLPRSAYVKIENPYYFKTPLNVVITDHKPERDFVRNLIKKENAEALDAWIKSTDQDFYSIDYGYQKGTHPKRGSFNPDFFIKKGKHILVIEIKGDEEVNEPSDENKAKYKAARQHFEMLNSQQGDTTYHFHFLSPQDYDKFFKFLRDSNFDFASKLDWVLAQNGIS